jgi:hypothetical protein
MRAIHYVVVVAFCGFVVVGAGATAQQTTPVAPYVPRQSDRPTPVEGDEPGFQPIFDGKTLTGWDGNPKYWRAEGGALVGEIRRIPSSRATPSSSGAAAARATSS